MKIFKKENENKYLRTKFRKNILFLILIFIAFLFLSIGYSSINSVTGEIRGIVSAKKPSGKIIITNAEIKESVNANVQDSAIIGIHETLLNSRVSLSPVSSNSSITLEITVYNNTDNEYVFTGANFDENFYDNNGIKFELDNITELEKIPGNSYKTFNVTFSYVNDVVAANNVLNSYIRFNFSKLYTISYEGIVDNNYPKSVLEGDNLQIIFEDSIPESIEVLGCDDYRYESDVLTINNINNNITIKGSGIKNVDFIVEDETGSVNEMTLTTDKVSSTNTATVDKYLGMQFNGVNITDRVIKKIVVNVKYTSSTGSAQSINCNLNTGGQTYTQGIKFLGKQDNATISVTFDNLNINPSETFVIENVTDKLTNSSVTISGKTINVYLSEN